MFDDIEVENDESAKKNGKINNVKSINEEIIETTSHFSTKLSPLRSSLIKRDAENRSAQTKYVSFSTQNDGKKICNVSDCIRTMQNGTEFIKLRANIKQFHRTFTLDSNSSHIYWTPTNKRPSRAKIAINSIKEIRIGRNTDFHHTTENYTNDMEDECAFSIIHGDQYKCLHLIAKTPEIAKIWITGLMSLISNQTGISESKPSDSKPLATLRERWLASVFDEADKEKCELLSEKEIIELVKKLNPRILIDQIELAIREASASNPIESQRGKITRSQFVEIYENVATRSEIYFLMVQYANNDYLSCHNLQVFLEAEQGLLDTTMEFCESIIEKYECCKEARELNCMTVDGFTNYLYSDENFLFDSTHQNVFQKMDQPFSDYFIATSFNTSLTEDQLKEPSNCQGYIEALRQNCRFIEVDVWEPTEKSNEEELMIHNCQRTSKLTLSAVLKVINEMAFQRTSYPLFIRLKTHLKIEWQMKLVDMLQNTFGDKLYEPNNDSIDWTKRSPTPEDFQMKIILIERRIGSTCKDIGEVIMEDENIETGLKDFLSESSKRMFICRKLSDLMCPWIIPITLNEMQALPHDTLNKNYHLLSSTENDCLKTIQNAPSECAQITKNNLFLVKPNRSRIDSSNANPQEFWNYGIQMVSLNYQTAGLMMDLQQGKFSENGGCGYVLKPSLMRNGLYTPGDIMLITPQILYLRILSGQNLPRPRESTAKGNSTDPYVVVEIFGCPIDCNEERTKTVKNGGANPSFDESFQFEITVPEMALIRFLVLDDDFIDDDFIGQYTIPFECIKTGYRHVPLLNSKGEVMENCTLFVYVAITDRCGGGKARRRSMSLKRKSTRVVTGMKLIGIKLVDEYFKQAIESLSASIEMRNVLESSLMKWRNDCGIGPAGSIRQGLRLMLTKTKATSSNALSPRSSTRSDDSMELMDNMPSFAICSDAQTYPMIVTRGVFPAQLQKTFDSMSELLDICAKILVNTAPLSAKLEIAIKRITECNDLLPDLCENAGIHGFKAARAHENFAWNVRLLKTHLTLMNKTKIEADNIVEQVFNVGCTLGILSEKSSTEFNAKHFSHHPSC